jgi:hypothetical protein
MKIIVTEQQYLNLLETIFNNLYTEVRYRKIRNTIFVYNGKSLVRTLWLNVGSRDSTPNTLMDYSDFGNYGRLTVYDRVYYEMVKWGPMLENNELFLKFFEQWFEKKFKKPVDYVVIGNKSIMDNLKNPFE